MFGRNKGEVIELLEDADRKLVALKILISAIQNEGLEKKLGTEKAALNKLYMEANTLGDDLKKLKEHLAKFNEVVQKEFKN